MELRSRTTHHTHWVMKIPWIAKILTVVLLCFVMREREREMAVTL